MADFASLRDDYLLHILTTFKLFIDPVTGDELNIAEQCTPVRCITEDDRLRLISSSDGTFRDMEDDEFFRVRRRASSVRNLDLSATRDPNSKRSDSQQSDGSIFDGAQSVFDQSDQGLVVVLGAPATGKTTLCKKFTYLCAIRAAERTDAAVPLYVDLGRLARKLAEGDILTYEDFINECFNLTHGHSQILRNARANKSLLLIFDGLDEVSSKRNLVCRWITEDLQQDSPRFVLVSSRLTGFLESYFQPYKALLVEVCSLEQLTFFAKHRLSEMQFESFINMLNHQSHFVQYASTPLTASLLLELFRWGAIGLNTNDEVDEKAPIRKAILYDAGLRHILTPSNSRRLFECSSELRTKYENWKAEDAHMRLLEDLAADNHARYTRDFTDADLERLGHGALWKEMKQLADDNVVPLFIKVETRIEPPKTIASVKPSGGPDSKPRSRRNSEIGATHFSASDSQLLEALAGESRRSSGGRSRSVSVVSNIDGPLTKRLSLERSADPVVVYRFAHLTFQEYLTAKYLLQRINKELSSRFRFFSFKSSKTIDGNIFKEVLRDDILYSSWYREVFIMLASAADDSLLEKLCGYLLEGKFESASIQAHTDLVQLMLQERSGTPIYKRIMSKAAEVRHKFLGDLMTEALVHPCGRIRESVSEEMNMVGSDTISPYFKQVLSAPSKGHPWYFFANFTDLIKKHLINEDELFVLLANRLYADPTADPRMQESIVRCLLALRRNGSIALATNASQTDTPSVQSLSDSTHSTENAGSENTQEEVIVERNTDTKDIHNADTVNTVNTVNTVIVTLIEYLSELLHIGYHRILEPICELQLSLGVKPDQLNGIIVTRLCATSSTSQIIIESAFDSTLSEPTCVTSDEVVSLLRLIPIIAHKDRSTVELLFAVRARYLRNQTVQETVENILRQMDLASWAKKESIAVIQQRDASMQDLLYAYNCLGWINQPDEELFNYLFTQIQQSIPNPQRHDLVTACLRACRLLFTTVSNLASTGRIFPQLKSVGMKSADLIQTCLNSTVDSACINDIRAAALHCLVIILPIFQTQEKRFTSRLLTVLTGYLSTAESAVRNAAFLAYQTVDATVVGSKDYVSNLTELFTSSLADVDVRRQVIQTLVQKLNQIQYSQVQDVVAGALKDIDATIQGGATTILLYFKDVNRITAELNRISTIPVTPEDAVRYLNTADLISSSVSQFGERYPNHIDSSTILSLLAQVKRITDYIGSQVASMLNNSPEEAEAVCAVCMHQYSTSRLIQALNHHLLSDTHSAWVDCARALQAVSEPTDELIQHLLTQLEAPSQTTRIAAMNALLIFGVQNDVLTSSFIAHLQVNDTSGQITQTFAWTSLDPFQRLAQLAERTDLPAPDSYRLQLTALDVLNQIKIESASELILLLGGLNSKPLGRFIVSAIIDFIEFEIEKDIHYILPEEAQQMIRKQASRDADGLEAAFLLRWLRVSGCFSSSRMPKVVLDISAATQTDSTTTLRSRRSVVAQAS